MKDLVKKAFKYCIVGGVASIADYSMYIVIAQMLGQETSLKLGIATTAGFIAGLCINYLLSLFVVWKVEKTSKTGKTTRDIVVFILIGVIGLGISWGIIAICNDLLHISYLVSKLIAMAITLVWNFVARNYLIFERKL